MNRPPEFNDLPPVMVERARWARKQIINNPQLAEIDEDELLAWVYHKEDNVWYSIAGNYSYSSPQEKMDKRRNRDKDSKEKQERFEKLVLERQVQQQYWTNIRKRILKRDKNTCQRCKLKFEKLEIHHIVKVKENGSDADDNLTTVCHKCHVVLDRKEYGIYSKLENGKSTN